tara:strand:- start:1001 stop:1426 length:426 start_codon:yes stop_codon:yes gene_type:complete
MSDNNSSDSENVQEKVTSEFKNKVLKWLSIDDQIREFRRQTKILTKEKKEHEEFILAFLENVGEKELAVSDGKLRRNVSKTKAPLNKASIQKALEEIVKDKTKSSAMTEHIINSRPIVERVNLKRTRNRGPRTKKNNNVDV